MIFFTADLHLGHSNIIKFTKRPFDSVAEMDQSLIENWNAVVGPNDVIYCIGDLTLNYDANQYISQLSGHIRVLSYPWHHDRFWQAKDICRSASGHEVELLPPLQVVDIPPKELGHDGHYPVPISLCHYEMTRWDRDHYGGWHLFGHDHRSHNLEEPGVFKVNVGVDSNKFTPVSLNAIHLQMVVRGWYYGWTMEG